MKLHHLLLLVSVLFLFGCEKSVSICEIIRHSSARTTDSVVAIGEDFEVFTRDLDDRDVNVQYFWTGPNNINEMGDRLMISNARIIHRGWYYLTIASGECTTKHDSVYVDVKLKQETPPCTVANNFCDFSNLTDQNFTYIRRYYAGSMKLQASGSSTVYVEFDSYFSTHEPEDGVYETVANSGLGLSYNKVHINTVMSSTNIRSREGQKVYVSHVNGKLQIRFCNLIMSGSGFFDITTVASGNMIEQ